MTLIPSSFVQNTILKPDYMVQGLRKYGKHVVIPDSQRSSLGIPPARGCKPNQPAICNVTVSCSSSFIRHSTCSFSGIEFRSHDGIMGFDSNARLNSSEPVRRSETINSGELATLYATLHTIIGNAQRYGV